MSRYHKKIAPDADGLIDLYAIAEAFGVKSNPQFHAFKKTIMAGQRGDKGVIQDIDEAIQALQRWKEMVQAELVAVPEAAHVAPPLSNWPCPICGKDGCREIHRATAQRGMAHIQTAHVADALQECPRCLGRFPAGQPCPTCARHEKPALCPGCRLNPRPHVRGAPFCEHYNMQCVAESPCGPPDEKPEPTYEELEGKAAEFTAGIIGDLLGGKAKEKPALCPVCKGGMGPENDGSCPECGAPGVSCT